MALFTVGAKGKDGNTYGIYVDVATFEDCENIIEQLGLQVEPTSHGELIEVIPISLEELLHIQGETKQ